MLSSRKKLVMCQVCRGLIEASAKTCPLCGRESVPPARISTSNITTGGSFFSLVILTINIVLFVLMSAAEVRNGRGADAFIQSASNGMLDDFGALSPSMVWAGQWWRLVTFNFLHIGLVHLMFNSSALFSIGPQVESIFGSQKFVFAYVGTGVASGVASLLFLPAGTAGASGAIFGLIGLMAAYGYRLGGSFGRALMRQMLIWAGIGIVFGFFIGANNVAHIGGLIAGGALGFVLAPDAPSIASSAARWNGAAIACIGLVAISFVMAGRVFGTEQEKDRQRESTVRKAKNAIQFANAVEEATHVVEESFDLDRSSGRTARDQAIRVATDLRRIATDLANAPAIDERCAEIKTRLVELITARATAFEKAENELMISAAASANRDAFDAAFNDFADWENKTVQDFQRVFAR